ncbi:CBP4 (YGR174C) [Zygosaccharomyces parabailii]|nr:CBP4 (YGR174C) [Zygosaccharomyces parabailii]
MLPVNCDTSFPTSESYYLAGRLFQTTEATDTSSKILTVIMETPLWIRWLKVWGYGGLIVATGCLLFKYTTPTDEQIINSLSPELRMQYEREKSLRQAEQQELMKIVKRTAESDDPIWKTGSIQSPFENSNAPQIKNRQQFEKLKADQVQREELKRINEELAKIRQETSTGTKQIVDERSKGWWKFW